MSRNCIKNVKIPLDDLHWVWYKSKRAFRLQQVEIVGIKDAVLWQAIRILRRDSLRTYGILLSLRDLPGEICFFLCPKGNASSRTGE